MVRYFNAAPDQAWAVGQAVRAWNTSGADVRFVAVPRARARLVIEEDSRKVYCTEGNATVGYVAGARVVIFPAHGLTHVCNRYWAARVMTHELGHVLGLKHEDRGCATMNASGSYRGGTGCGSVPPWLWRCRLLEPDDVAGAVWAYGGRARPAREPALCPLYRAIRPPGGAEASWDPAAGRVELSFRRPAEPAVPAFVIPSPWHGKGTFAVAGPLRRCSTRATAPSSHYLWNVAAGATERIDPPAAQGTSCYELWAVDRLGRPSATDSVVSVTVG